VNDSIMPVWTAYAGRIPRRHTKALGDLPEDDPAVVERSVVILHRIADVDV